jgi:hypothetical protein
MRIIMALSILGIVLLVAVHFLVRWWEDENIDKSSGSLTGHSIESEVNQGTEKRKTEKRNKLEAEVLALNKAHPDRLFYRDGPRIYEYTSKELFEIRECERLNATYDKAYPHYFIRSGRVEYGEDEARKYKFEARTRELNQDHHNGINCTFDRKNVRLINKNTGEEIPFDLDSYNLPASHFKG